ncbi:MAG: holo-ACP synthase [Candidatus Kapaibacteriales bacterium]
MIRGIGIDLIEVDRVQKAIENYGDRFLKRVFTETEIRYCETFKESKYVHYAARFAVKEAFSKAIGTGLTNGFKFNSIGTRNEANGFPIVELYDNLKEKYNSYRIIVSISHIINLALAVVIIEE